MNDFKEHKNKSSIVSDLDEIILMDSTLKKILIAIFGILGSGIILFVIIKYCIELFWS